MSIHKGDFSAAQRANIEALADRLMIPFSAAVRMLVDRGLTPPLTGETIEGALAVSSPELEVSAEIKNTNPEDRVQGKEPESAIVNEPDPSLVEALRASRGASLGIATPKSKRPKRPTVEIPEPPKSIDSPELRAFLPEFVAYRKALGSGKGLKTAGQWDYLFRHLATCAGRQHAVLGLKYAMAKGWMCLETGYLNGKSWATIASELGLSLEAEKPAPPPADLAALNLARVIEDARKEIPRLAPAEDGWTSYSRTVFFDHLSTCKSEAEVADHLARSRALCDRLRALGAFPLRRATQVGEILPAGGGARIVVDLRDGFIGDTICPACGEDQNRGLCFCEDRDADLARRVGAECCPHGTPYSYPCEDCDANPDLGHGEGMVGDDTPLEELETDHEPPHTAIVESHVYVPHTSGGQVACHRCAQPRWALCHSMGEVVTPPRVGPGDHELRRDELQRKRATYCAACAYGTPGVDSSGVHPDPRWPGWSNTESSVDRSGIAMIPEKTTAGKVRKRAKIADGQHAYTHNALTGGCAWCQQGEDHIRHYLPQELPFGSEEK